MAVIVGLTGSIATGKSLVSKYFKELGVPIIDYDLVSKMVVEPGLPAWHDIANYFGREILHKDQTLDRPKLGVIVFGDEEKRRKLESFIHPRMEEEVQRQEKAALEADPDAVVIHDVPLLFETGLDKRVEKTIVVYASEENQLKRLKKRDAMSEEDAISRIKAQFPLAEKMKRADFVIYNDGSLEETKRQVEKLNALLREVAKMEQKGKWSVLIRRLEGLLRLKTFPVAFKLLEDPEELTKNKWVRRFDRKMALCQLITIVRTFDWTVGATGEDLLPMCASVIGLAELPAEAKDGTFRSLVWCKTKEDGKKYEDSIPRIPMGKYQAVILAPLVYEPFEPDIVLIYGNPAQMILIINAIQFEDYERLEFFCVGETSCADAIAQCYLSGKPSLTIPCYGERRYGHAQDDEMVIALPPRIIEKVERNLQELYARGIRYPISYSGAQLDVLPAMPPAYLNLGIGESVE